MRLTTLEIKGFKSFGDKVTIHFDKGVTAVVGPNGSGKSNVVDAIRWVLGEQKTRMLRSEKMENIIFNGTKNRKPANLAEVHLTFENNKGILPTEYTTVCISRRLYRTGESEYLLNGITCRLKDITDLFLDTGIGSDSYAIIELKMIDEILNDKNNTIKFLLEEAAGISKYKIRKKQTYHKLEETDADLNRVNDLLFEIEKSLKQLESQAKKTQKFYRLKDEYKEVSMAYSLYAVREFSQSLHDLQKKEETVSDEKLQYHVDLDVIEANIQKLKTESLEKEKSLSLVQKELNEIILQITKGENENKNIQDRIGFLHEKQNQLRHQNDTDETTITELNESISQLSQEKTAEETSLKSLESQLAEMKHNVEENKHLYESSIHELKELGQQLHDIRQEINKYETQVAVRQARSNSIREEMQRLNDQVKSNEEKLALLNQEIDLQVPQHAKLQSDAVEAKKIWENAEVNLRDMENRLRTMNQELAEEKRKCDIKTNEHDLTRSLIERMEGFPESIKYLKGQSSKFNHAPLVSEVISCEDEYKNAIENYLEPYLNYFIVSTTQEAWEALQLLNDSSKGRAHFFVLDNLRDVRSTSGSPLPGCRHALSLTDFDATYSKLIEHLLGNVYILENSDDINNLDTSAFEGGYIILSKNGRFLRQRYTMSGGSLGMGDGKRTGKQKNLQQLSDQIKVHQESIENLQSQISIAEKELNAQRELFSNSGKNVNRLENEAARAGGQVNTLNNNRDFLTSAIEYTRTTGNQLNEELNSLANPGDHPQVQEGFSIESQKSELQQLLDQQKVKQEFSNDLQRHVNDMTNAFNQKNIQFFQQQNKLQNISRDISFKTNQVNNLTKSREEHLLELEGISAQLQTLQENSTQAEALFSGLSEKKTEIEVVVRTQEDDYYKSKGEIDREEKLISDKRKQKEHSDLLIREIHNQINDLKLKMTSLKERLSIEFNIILEEIMDQEPNPELNPDDLKARSEKLKSQLSDFGPINPMALESFKEIKERHDFIVKEQNDLKEAKESLLKTIAEIDNTAKEKFMDAYHAVRENFIHVFRSLFSEEDNCDLILTDLANPLDSDVQIIAQPKGKKPLSIHQLSGGEKTLTATALLFGIYLLKPSPFCIFDEVDAPLDDSNIDKFNKIIKKFSADSQFIIITHNKKTMSATDIMYGITMVEQGVTQVVPVDLREYA
ncbi:MAG: chromosome segregation protein SMC [Bacteroidota bacterium]|nr:chromosome segregation protein SMC [Bacteroidota bacterium]